MFHKVSQNINHSGVKTAISHTRAFSLGSDVLQTFEIPLTKALGH